MVMFLSVVISDSIILIMLARQEMLGEIIPLRVEKDLVKDNVSQYDY